MSNVGTPSGPAPKSTVAACTASCAFGSCERFGFKAAIGAAAGSVFGGLPIGGVDPGNKGEAKPVGVVVPDA